MPEQIRKATLIYRIGGGVPQQLDKLTYPFEFTVPVHDPGQPFRYTVQVTDTSGAVQSSVERELRPLDGVAPITTASLKPSSSRRPLSWCHV